jgi:hypothetical protein
MINKHEALMSKLETNPKREFAKLLSSWSQRVLDIRALILADICFEFRVSEFGVSEP